LKDYLPQSILKLELKTVKRNESSSTMLNAANGNANTLSNSASSSNLANQVTLMRNESNNSFVYSTQRSMMSPSSDSSDSVLTCNNNNKSTQQQVQPTNQPTPTNTETSTTNNPSEANVAESTVNSIKTAEINEDELNANNKRAYSPTAHEHLQTQIKKPKESLFPSETALSNKSTNSNGVAETNGTELKMAVDNQTATNPPPNELVEEELLDSLPMPQSTNRLINSNSISLLKNSIRVNIGCNKK